MPRSGKMRQNERTKREKESGYLTRGKNVERRGSCMLTSVANTGEALWQAKTRQRSPSKCEY